MRRVVGIILVALCWAATATAQTTTDALLDSLQHKSFLYFWYESNAANGLMKDRNTSGSPCSIASEGFGLSAICIAIDHGWITRNEGKTRVLTALQTFWNSPQGTAASGTIGYKGFFYHFLDMSTGLRMVSWDPELSSIDTALLLAGILDAKQYFTNSGDPVEAQIRALADSINQRVDWAWMQNGNPGVMMGWKPSAGFSGFGQWVGYNEAMILYILALGSPTHAVAPAAWTTWTSGYLWATNYYGQSFIVFPPLFGHQYSHCWIDFRNIWDSYLQGKGITYFENSRRATYAQRAYCIANPLARAAYSDSMWGLTAGDGPTGYIARGAPPTDNDDGTLSPTAPASSIAFAPEIAIPAIRNMYNTYKISIWGPYGFVDAFNPGRPWWDTDVIGIDQGPMVMMIENWRNQAVWTRFMRNPEIYAGLQRAGFTASVADVGSRGPVAGPALLWSEPNPFADAVTLRFRLPAEGPVRLAVYDVSGREVAKLADGVWPAGVHEVGWQGGRLPSGVYYARLQWNGGAVLKRLVRLD